MARILIADDDHEVRLLLKNALRADDYTFIEVSDGEDVLRQVEQDAPDLILLDVMMPQLDGMETLQRLKSGDSTRDIPVIMCTNLDMESQIAMFLDEGAVDHIAKPFSPLVARARVRAALRSKSSAGGSAEQAKERGRCIAFLGAKGGVGTTTVALNSAAALAAVGKRVYAVELTPFFGSFAPQLDLVGTEHHVNQLLEGADGEIPFEQLRGLLIPHRTGIEILLGPPPDGVYRAITPGQAEALVQSLQGQADYTLFDVGHFPSPTVQAVLRRCDLVVVVLEREVSSLVAVSAVLRTLKLAGVGGSALGAVVVNRTAVCSPIRVEYLKQNIRCPIIGMIPPDPDTCMAAARSGAPLVSSRPETGIASALQQLGQHLMEDCVPALAF